ncbi:MAG TPA: VWA domain-containing protein [Gemmatimonadaceae bacterium]|nr:VWA domain-containing protein [Gemmatimonadaceae bacterium]
MTFETPTFDYAPLLALALLLPVAAVILLLAWHRRRRARLSRLGTPEMIARLAPAAAARPVAWRAVRLATAAALLGIAIAGPRWGVERQLVRGEGIDMVLALDASVSMLATDARPNRLTQVKNEVRRLRSLSGADRVALLAFAGRSYILTPLTVDNGALDLFLDNLDPSVVGQAGSSIARTLRQGTDLLLVTKTGSDRALVIMSDGEAFEPQEDVEAAARRAAESGISLVTVGFGTAQGSTIPVRDENGQTVEKRDENGQVVVTRYHPELLRAAATAANGTFIDASESDKAGKIRGALARLRTQSRALEAGRERTPRFQLFVLPALLLLLLDTLLAERRGRRSARGPAAATAAGQAAAALLLALLPLASGCGGTGRLLGEADAAFRAKQYARAAALYRQAIDAGDRTPQTAYNYGTALVNADSLSQGVEALDRALQTVDRALRERPADRAQLEEVQFRTLFNQGLAHLRRGLAMSGDSAQPELDATLAIYKRALLMRSTHGDAKWNYELALRKKQSGGGGGGGGGGQDSPSKSESPTSEAPAPQPRPAGGIGRQQADELLNSAARDERDVQGKRQKQNRAEPPPGGKDW